MISPSPGGPRVVVLDAREQMLDPHGLRRLARRITAATGAKYASRAYRFPYALLAWHDHPVGIDIERDDPLDSALAEVIATPAERALPSPPNLAALWCAKEALTKALGDPLRYDPARIDSPLRWTNGRSGPWRAIPLNIVAGHHTWMCWASRSVIQPAQRGQRATRTSLEAHE